MNCKDICYDRTLRKIAKMEEDADDDDEEPTQDFTNYCYGKDRNLIHRSYEPVLKDFEVPRCKLKKAKEDADKKRSTQSVVIKDSADVYQISSSRDSMSKDRAKIRTVTSNANILSARNPDIFETTPRPGGFMKICTDKPKMMSADYAEICDKCMRLYDYELKLRNIDSSKIFKRSSKPSIHAVQRETESREFRIKRALEESDWETTAIDETDTVVGISNPNVLGMNMLAVTITCIMMMVSKIPMSIDYLEWAESYLECIKDDNNKTPRNIEGILGEIQKAKATATERDAPRVYRPRTPRPDSSKNRGCRIYCGIETNRGKCTATSSCTMSKNLCARIRLPSPNMPRCGPKCGHIPTVDDFVPPQTDQQGKEHI